MKVLRTWSTSAKRMIQRRKRKEWIIMEPFYNIIKRAIIQRTFLQYYKMGNHTKNLFTIL